MTTEKVSESIHAEWLRRIASDIAKEGHNGWGNTCLDCAERLEYLERELASRRALDEWRPIESAPRDGTVVLLGRDMGTAWGFVRGYGYYDSARNFNSLATGKCVISGWIASGFTDPPGNLGLGNPTRWKPLPPPPAQDDEHDSDETSKWQALRS